MRFDRRTFVRALQRGFTIHFAGCVVVFAAASLAALPSLFAQGPAGTQPQVTQPIQLPLSGRPAQSGSVSAIESPVPGTTTSVNTVNATTQVQGPYSGSTRGFAN